MSFLQQLRLDNSVACDLLILSLVILAGIGLGNIRFRGVKLGTAGVLFAGLAASHFGLRPETEVAHFLKEFGLVLFVFALGMQMGPGFFASPTAAWCSPTNVSSAKRYANSASITSTASPSPA